MNMNVDYAGRIAALLAKAEDPAATPEEAESYSAKAEQLMLKWGISDAHLDVKRRSQKKGSEKIVEKKITIKGSFCRGETALGFAAGRGLGAVKMLKANGRSSTMEQVIYFIGFESDVDRAMTLFMSLQAQARLARKAWWKDYDEKKHMTNNERFLAQRQFIISFAHVVEQRLNAMREETVKDSEPGTELVLVGRSEQVDDWVNTKYPKLGHGKGVNGSWAGRAEGRAAGAKARLGGNEIDTGKAGSLEAAKS